MSAPAKAGGASIGRAELSVLAAAILFSTGGAAIKSTALSSWQVAGFRSGVAALAMLLLVPAARRGWDRRVLPVSLAYAATLITFVAANKLTTAANAIFLQSTAPLYVLLVAPWLLGERIRRSDWALIAVLAVGMGLFFVGTEAAVATAPDPARGNLLAALSGLFYAMLIVGLRWASAGGGADAGLATVVAGNGVAFLACLPLALPIPAAAGTQDALAVGYLGVVQIALAYWFLVGGLRQVPAFAASLLLLIEPALSPIWAWLAHGERPGGWAIAGGLLILGATAAKAWIDARGGPVPEPAAG